MIGGNENVVFFIGILVKCFKVSIYMFFVFILGLVGIFMVGWLGSVMMNFG